jgi:soluble lytic murein transglycosylase-like protein
LLTAAVLLLSTATPALADDSIPEDVAVAAAEAGVEPINLLGAVYSTGLPPREYLYLSGELEPPYSPPQNVRPTGADVRVACIEAKESGGANVANRHGSGAVGVMQYMPRTFARGAAEMGHPEWSPWNPAQARAVAAHDLALGRRAQWAVGGC